MPKVDELLERDHRRIEQLFSKFRSTNDRSFLDTIVEELEVHTTLEEEHVYPVLKSEVSEELAEHSEMEHREADAIIQRIRIAGEGDLTQLAQELEEAVQHHVEEEESNVFPEMNEKLGAERMKELGERLEAARGEQGGSVTDLTKEELYEQAQEQGIEGRSSMTKDELADAVREG